MIISPTRTSGAPFIIKIKSKNQKSFVVNKLPEDSTLLPKHVEEGI
jgi:hypothetical protein